MPEVISLGFYLIGTEGFHFVSVCNITPNGTIPHKILFSGHGKHASTKIQHLRSKGQMTFLGSELERRLSEHRPVSGTSYIHVPRPRLRRALCNVSTYERD